MTLRLREHPAAARSSHFEPLDPANVRIYSCGPTVYAPAHIGNFRSFLFADLLAATWAGAATA